MLVCHNCGRENRFTTLNCSWCHFPLNTGISAKEGKGFSHQGYKIPPVDNYKIRFADNYGQSPVQEITSSPDIDYHDELYTHDKSAYLMAIFYLITITCAELTVSLWNPIWGIVMHILLFFGLIIYSSLAKGIMPQKFLLTLALAPLIRILSLSMPLGEFSQIYWYAIVSIPLFFATLVVMRKAKLHSSEVGFKIGNLPFQLLIMLTGFLFGITEYYILQPEPLISVFDWKIMILPAAILFFCTGFMEEFVFRGVMQKVACNAIGDGTGLIFLALIFTAMHIGYLSLPDIALVFVVGLFFGIVVNKTGSILGVTLSHGITNIMLYLIAPFFF
jgi:uncharacterized protein